MQKLRSRMFIVVATLGALLIAPASPAQAAVSMKISSGSAIVPNNTVRVKKVACPAGTVVVAGGANVEGSNGFTRLTSSYPYDGGDSDSVPDDGWAAGYANRAGNDRRFTVFARCVSGVTPRYVKSSAVQVVGALTNAAYASATCPKGYVAVSGGGRLSGNASPTFALIGLLFGGGGGLTDLYQALAFGDTSGVNQTLNAFAVCAKGLNMSYFHDSESVPPGDIDPDTTTFCNSGIQFGAGAVWLQLNKPFGSIHTFAPTAPGRWTVRMINSASETRQYQSQGNCVQP